MKADDARATNQADTLDAIVRDLQQLRADAGNISYGEIAVRVAGLREAAGATPAAARVARSSVHSMFAPGRRRMNPDFLAEIVAVLSVDTAHSPTVSQEWRARCVEVQRCAGPTAAPAMASVSAMPPPLAEGVISRQLTMLPTSAAAAAGRFSPLTTVLILVASVGLNHYGGTLNAKFELPLFLDMIGTAVVAIALGPWYGALVGLTSSALGALAANPVSLAFSLVNIAGALVWGYGVRSWRMRSPWWRFVLLSMAVALVCSLVAVPINVLLFGGVADGHAAVGFVSLLLQDGEGLWRAVFSVNLVISVIDKVLSGLLALAAVVLLERFRASL